MKIKNGIMLVLTRIYMGDGLLAAQRWDGTTWGLHFNGARSSDYGQCCFPVFGSFRRETAERPENAGSGGARGSIAGGMSVGFFSVCGPAAQQIGIQYTTAVKSRDLSPCFTS